MGNTYLIAAYAFTGGLLVSYVWSLVRRKARLRRELERLKKSDSQS